MRGPRFLLGALLLAGAVWGFGTGFASLAGADRCHHCPHQDEAPFVP